MTKKRSASWTSLTRFTISALVRRGSAAGRAEPLLGSLHAGYLQTGNTSLSREGRLGGWYRLEEDVGVHNAGNRRTDLSGENVLLSKHFYYFGNKPLRLPTYLMPIVHQTQGHKVTANKTYLDPFLKWLRRQQLKTNCLIGELDLLRLVATQLTACAKVRCQCDEENESAAES